VNALVAKRNNLRQVGNAGSQGIVEFGQLVERLTDDFELALYGPLVPSRWQRTR
jgi:hypothetical protein